LEAGKRKTTKESGAETGGWGLSNGGILLHAKKEVAKLSLQTTGAEKKMGERTFSFSKKRGRKGSIRGGSVSFGCGNGTPATSGL